MRKLFVSKLCMCLFWLCTTSECANILAVVPTPFYSHQTTYHELWRNLAKRGHQITLITANPMEQNENITQIDISKIYAITSKYNIPAMLQNLNWKVFNVIRIGSEMLDELFEFQLSQPQVKRLLKEDVKFDLVMTEALMPVFMAFGFRKNCPYIGFISFEGHLNTFEAIGNPSHPILYPDVNLPFYEKLSFAQRLSSLSQYVIFKAVMWYAYYRQDLLIKRYLGEDMPPLLEIEKNVSLTFMNANPVLNHVRPLLPSSINVGSGIHFKDAKPLPKDLEEYLEGSSQGVIYFSLGTVVDKKELSNQILTEILITFSELPYNILWKYSPDNLPFLPQNVKVVKWLPQQDVLRHKNILLFITQGGVHSLEEALYNFVPIIGIPFFGDQVNNVNRMVAKGLGLRINIEKLNVKTFKSAIAEVITNRRYKEASTRIGKEMFDQPMSGLKKAIWWTEYVIRHKGADQLKSSANIYPLYQYLMLDILGFLVIVLFLSGYIFYKLTKVSCRILRKIIFWGSIIKKKIE